MNRPRRVRSPPFGYDPRMMGRAEPNRPMPDFDDLYNQAPFDGPPLMQHGPAFIEPPAHPHYPPVAAYRDHRLPSTYRASLRDPQQLSQVTSSTAPYKILCVTNINHKVSDGPVKDALTSDFSRFGDISVSICHDSGERLAYIYFKSYEEAREARHAKSRTLLFDRPIEIEPIYEPRTSPPIDSPPPPQAPQQPPPLGYPTRRRSITPSDYYGPPPTHSSRRAPPPPPPPPMSQHRGLSPPPINYPHASRYPSAHSPPPMQPGSMPFGRYYMQPNQMPPLSPYSSPPHDQYRSYHPHPTHFPPGPQYNSSYGPPPAPSRERDRPINEPHLARSPRHEAYYMMDHRGYPPQPPMSHRPSSSIHSSSSHHHHLQHHPNMSPIMHHHHSSSSSNRRSPPLPHSIEHPRYADRRESRREKFNNNDNEPEEGRPSRVLFATNIDPSKSEGDLRDIFESFGPIEDVEIRKVSIEFSSALIKFSSMDCAYKAKTATNGKYLGNLRCRLTYGKVNTSRRLWIGGLGPLTTMLRLEDGFGKFGNIINLDYISGRPYAYIEFESANQAQFATLHLRGKIVAEAERRIRIEFVDPVERNDKTSKSDSNLQPPDISSKSRASNDAVCNSFDSESQSQSNNRKRSLSPTEMSTKRSNAQALDTSMKSSEKYESDYNHESDSARLNSPNHEDKSIEEKDELNNNQGNIKNPEDAVVDLLGEPESFDIKSEDNGCSIIKLTRSRSIREIIDCCSVSWFVQLVLRNFNFPSRMFICSGNKVRVEKYLTKLNGENGTHCPILRITQRWRLHPQPKLEEVKRRMQAGNLAMIVITSNPEQSPSLSSPTCKTPQSLTSQPVGKQNGDKESADNMEERSDQATGAEGLATQSRPLKNLISYLEQKDAAGVISLTAPDLDQSEGSKLLYAFPPGDFALNLLKNKAPNLSQECLKEEYLLGVIVGNTETKI